MTKIEFRDGSEFVQERPQIQEIIASLKRIATDNGFNFCDSLFKIEDDPRLQESKSQLSKQIDEQLNQIHRAEEFLDQTFDKTFSNFKREDRLINR